MGKVDQDLGDPPGPKQAHSESSTPEDELAYLERGVFPHQLPR